MSEKVDNGAVILSVHKQCGCHVQVVKETGSPLWESCDRHSDARIVELELALKILYEETADYIRINHSRRSS